MAILIPSKNIYKKQNEKIVDNLIERIEVNAVEVVPNNDYETPIYNEKIEIDISNLGENSNTDEDTVIISNTTTGGGYTARTATMAFVAYDAKKSYNATLYIQVVKGNKYIKKLLLGKDKDGQANIKYSIYGKRINYTAKTNATLEWGAKTATAKVSLSAISHTESSTSPEQFLDFPEKIEMMTKNNPPLENKLAQVELTDIGTVKDVVNAPIETIDGVEYYKLSFSIMSSIRTIQLSGSANSQEAFTTLPLEGVSTQYIPTQIEITVYGNTIGVDLTDQLLEIQGDSGQSKKVFSVDSNELVQTTNYYLEPFPISDLEIEYYYDRSSEKGKVKFADNTPRDFDVKIKVNIIDKSTNSVSRQTILKIYKGNTDSNSISLDGLKRLEIVQTNDVRHNALINTFSSTLNEYKSGKETATILCDINDYYEFDSSTGKKIIAGKEPLYIDKSSCSVLLVSNSDFWRLTFTITNTHKNTVRINFNVLVDGALKQGYVLIPVGEISAVYNINKSSNVGDIVIINAFEVLPMTFNIGDEVVPMVFDAEGKDVPLSRYKNGTPKVFKVLGVRPYYDGAVWQELSLQET